MAPGGWLLILGGEGGKVKTGDAGGACGSLEQDYWCSFTLHDKQQQHREREEPETVNVSKERKTKANQNGIDTTPKLFNYSDGHDSQRRTLDTQRKKTEARQKRYQQNTTNHSDPTDIIYGVAHFNTLAAALNTRYTRTRRV